MVKLEAVTDVSDARDRLEAFINYSGELATYDAVDQVLYEQCNVPGAATFLVEQFGNEPTAESIVDNIKVFSNSTGQSTFQASIWPTVWGNDVLMIQKISRVLRKPKTIRYANLTLNASSDMNAAFDKQMGHVLANKYSANSQEDFRSAIALRKRDALEEDAIVAAATKLIEEASVEERSKMAIYVRTIQSLAELFIKATKV